MANVWNDKKLDKQEVAAIESWTEEPPDNTFCDLFATLSDSHGLQSLPFNMKYC